MQRGAYWNNTKFSNCNLSRIQLGGAQLRESQFDDCNLTNVSLRGALEGSVFRRCNLNGTQIDSTTGNLDNPHSFAHLQLPIKLVECIFETGLSFKDSYLYGLTFANSTGTVNFTNCDTTGLKVNQLALQF
jgi:uncharacterized protein YjbI with pentapeptide repeats